MRDNNKRFSAGADPAPAVADAAKPSLDFATPTELVDLPSKGRFYSPNHPLHNQETIEIKYMTARDEDILTSPTLLKKGVAIDRFLQNVILNQRINVSSLLSGDKREVGQSVGFRRRLLIVVQSLDSRMFQSFKTQKMFLCLGHYKNRYFSKI